MNSRTKLMKKCAVHVSIPCKTEAKKTRDKQPFVRNLSGNGHV